MLYMAVTAKLTLQKSEQTYRTDNRNKTESYDKFSSEHSLVMGVWEKKILTSVCTL